jgi:hypothetical protein
VVVKFRGRGDARVAAGEWRRIATDKTLKRYRRTRFSWANGQTCIHLAWCQLRNMGHRPPKLPQFLSARSAKRALGAEGYSSVTELLDAVVGADNRIAPAQMMLGDLATLEGTAGMDAINICAGPQRVFGWREGLPGLVVLAVGLDEVKVAWRL